MTYRTLAAVALAAAITLCATVIAADTTPVHEIVIPHFQHALPNLPGQTLTVVIVDYPPGAKSVSHHHGKSPFIYVYVLSGTICSQVDDEPARVYRVGENWFEMPGAHHTVSENASATESARLLAVFVADTGERLTIPDQH